VVADEEVLAYRAVDGDRVLGDVGGQGAVGQVKVAIRAGVHDGGQFGG
jgi:ribosomal protein S28E/S33